MTRDCRHGVLAGVVLAIGLGAATATAASARELESEAVKLSGPAIVLLMPEDPCGAANVEPYLDCTAADISIMLRQQVMRLRSRAEPLEGELVVRRVPKNGVVLEMPPFRTTMQIDSPVTLVVCPPIEMRARAGAVPDDVLTQELAACAAGETGRRTRR